MFSFIPGAQKGKMEMSTDVEEGSSYVMVLIFQLGMTDLG